MQQEYLVLVKIGGAGDPEVWQPGSKILLDEERAKAHLLAGNVRPLEQTTPPQLLPAPVEVIHEPEEGESWQP